MLLAAKTYNGIILAANKRHINQMFCIQKCPYKFVHVYGENNTVTLNNGMYIIYGEGKLK
jgi:Fe-S-cluster-containing dehydrogenase component